MVSRKLQVNILSFMKGLSILCNQNNKSNIDTETKDCNKTTENDKEIGDIDELIFAEDEPRYISER